VTTILSPSGDDMSNELTVKNGIRWQVVAWVLGVVVTGLMTYNATAASYDRRISVLESQREEVDRRFEETERRLQRMEAKLDELLYRTKP